jgi:ATP-dependent Clp protease ATP-binding subunit ClpA
MFERFTNRARRVVVLAQEEARLLQHNYIGTEHLLLGLLAEREGVAARALESLGVSLEAARQQVEGIIGLGKQEQSGHIPFTPRAKKVLELSLREALRLGRYYIDTEHILLGLLREGDGVAAEVLVRLGNDLNAVRRCVFNLAPGPGDEPDLPEAAPHRRGFEPDSLQEIMAILINISGRLASIEEHLGIRPRRAAAAVSPEPAASPETESERPPPDDDAATGG